MISWDAVSVGHDHFSVVSDWSGWWDKTVDTFCGCKNDEDTESYFLVVAKIWAGLARPESKYLKNYKISSLTCIEEMLK